MVRRWIQVGLVVGFVVTSSTALADVFELFNGGRVVGDLLNPDEMPRKTFEIRTPQGGVLSLLPEQVAGKAEKTEDERWYEAAAARMARDAAGHLAMASECKARRLEAQRIYHLEAVLKLDPDHADARRELGYGKIDGKWVNTDQWFRQRGYVRHQGKWRLPQELAIEQAAAQQEEAAREWLRQIRMWRSWVIKHPERAADGARHILAVADPAAAGPLIQLLGEKNEPSQLKQLYLQVLGRFPGSHVSVALARCALLDQNPQIQEEAVNQLVARQDRFATRVFVGVLRETSSKETAPEQNVLVNRAATALARLKDPEAILPLIDALTTKHKELVSAGGGNINPTFTNDPAGGSGAFSFGGGGPKYRIREVQNSSVRDALLAMFPHTNYGFDKLAWKRWYDAQNTPAVVDLRRDP